MDSIQLTGQLAPLNRPESSDVQNRADNLLNRTRIMDPPRSSWGISCLFHFFCVAQKMGKADQNSNLKKLNPTLKKLNPTRAELSNLSQRTSATDHQHTNSLAFALQARHGRAWHLAAATRWWW
jgi:hypothetical protein